MQKGERHYCMTGEENLTFPFIPIKDPNAISTLSMEIKFDKYRNNQSLLNLLRGLPLSPDRTNHQIDTFEVEYVHRGGIRSHLFFSTISAWGK